MAPRATRGSTTESFTQKNGLLFNKRGLGIYSRVRNGTGSRRDLTRSFTGSRRDLVPRVEPSRAASFAAWEEPKEALEKPIAVEQEVTQQEVVHPEVLQEEAKACIDQRGEESDTAGVAQEQAAAALQQGIDGCETSKATQEEVTTDSVLEDSPKPSSIKKEEPGMLGGVSPEGPHCPPSKPAPPQMLSEPTASADNSAAALTHAARLLEDADLHSPRPTHDARALDEHVNASDLKPTPPIVTELSNASTTVAASSAVELTPERVQSEAVLTKTNDAEPTVDEHVGQVARGSIVSGLCKLFAVVKKHPVIEKRLLVVICTLMAARYGFSRAWFVKIAKIGLKAKISDRQY